MLTTTNSKKPLLIIYKIVFQIYGSKIIRYKYVFFMCVFLYVIAFILIFQD